MHFPIAAMDHHGNFDPDLCAAAAPGCQFQTSSNQCVISRQLTQQLAALKPTDVGVCSAACYLRVLDSCPVIPGRNSLSQEAVLAAQSSKACWAARGCTWVNNGCEPDLYSSKLDKWGLKITKAVEVCRQQNEPWGCSIAGAKASLPLREGAVQAALGKGMIGHGMLDGKCPL